MRSARLVFLLALLGFATPGLLLAPAPAYAEDTGGDDDDDEFETMWIGAKLGAWYRPNMDMDVQVNGPDTAGNPLFSLVGTDFDIKRDLGVSENVFTEHDGDFNREAIPELEIFLETEWVSFYFFFVPPFEYRGEATLTRTIVFAGQTFSASTPVESSFEQFYLGFDVTVNIFNNRYFKIAPLVGIRTLGIDWELKAPMLGLKADTSDIASPLEFDDFQAFPYAEVGGDIRVGYRDYIEVGVKFSGSWLSYFDVEGSTYRLEAFVAVYPIPWIGIQVGARSAVFDLKKKGSDVDPDETDFDIDLEYTGFTGGVTVRF